MFMNNAGVPDTGRDQQRSPKTMPFQCFPPHFQFFVRTVFASIRRRARIPASNRQARCGAVTFVQRFGDALNLNVHFHTMASMSLAT